MINFIIDAANEKINFAIVAEEQSYTTSYANSRENFDNLVFLLFEFLNFKSTNIKEIDNIFVNQGPGKFSGIRASLAIVKGLGFANKIDIYGYNSNEVINKDYTKIIDLFKKGVLKKNLIKPYYSS